MGADGYVIGFTNIDEHVKNMIVGRIKELEEVKEATKNIKNLDELEIDVDFNPIYPKEDRKPLITISFSTKDSVSSPDDPIVVIGGGAPAPSTSPPVSDNVEVPVSEIDPIQLNAKYVYEIFDKTVTDLKYQACFNQDIEMSDDEEDRSVEDIRAECELKIFLEKYPDYSYYDNLWCELPEDNFIVNCCSEDYDESFDEDIQLFYEDMIPSETQENKNLRETFFSLFPTWETIRYYFDNVDGEMLIKYDEFQVWT